MHGSQMTHSIQAFYFLCIMPLALSCRYSDTSNHQGNQLIWAKNRQTIFNIYVNSLYLKPSTRDVVQLNKWKTQVGLNPGTIKEI